MADYWKSIDKKYCDVCKCWLTDNKASIQFHENGNRHKQNIQARIKDIHKKNRAEQKSNRKMENDLRKIEQAAAAASKKDKEANPDVSMKIQAYMDKVKEEEGPEASTSDKSAKKSNQPTILHRTDKQKRNDETLMKIIDKADRDYNRLGGGWKVSAHEKDRAKAAFLELPSASSKSPGVSLLLAAKAEAEEPIAFGERTVTNASSSSIRPIVKLEEPEVAFKKRKMSKGNVRTVRRRDEDE